LKTDASGKMQLSFYTSDLVGKYLVLIEGLGIGGRAGTKTISIDVVSPTFANK
jgi:hypothetical protein